MNFSLSFILLILSDISTKTESKKKVVFLIKRQQKKTNLVDIYDKVIEKLTRISLFHSTGKKVYIVVLDMKIVNKYFFFH